MRQNYDGNIEENAEKARLSEAITMELLAQIMPDIGFKSLHDDSSKWHYGDIISTDGKYYDTKDDGRINETGNVFAEYRKEWKDKYGCFTGEVSDGWMLNSKYDYVCVLDMIGNNIYVLDFKKLKKIYNRNCNKRKVSHLKDNDSWGYCVPLWRCRENDVVVYETPYYYDEEWDMYSIGKIEDTILQ